MTDKGEDFFFFSKICKIGQITTIAPTFNILTSALTYY